MGGTSDQYLFRRAIENKLVTLDQRHHLIDIYVSAAVNKNPEAVQFIWDDVRITPASTLTRLHYKIDNVSDHFYQKFAAEMTKHEFFLCRQFVEVMHEKFRYKVVSFEPRTASFDILHDDELSGTMREGTAKSQVVSLFRQLLARVSHEEVGVQIQMERISANEQELHEEIPDTLESLLLKRRKQDEVMSTVRLNQSRKKDKEYIERMNKRQVELNDIIDVLTRNIAKLLQSLDRPKEQPSKRAQYGQDSHIQAIDYRKETYEARTLDEADYGQAVGGKSAADDYETALKLQEDLQRQLSEPDAAQAVGDPVLADQKMALLESIKLRGSTSGDPVQRRLRRAIEDNLAPGRSQRSANSMCTVLCLDSSESMKGNAFDDMKRIALQIVDGIEENAELSLEENIAVVAISDHASVVQHLTNDYTKVREVIDQLTPRGRSPFYESLLVCLCALYTGSVANVDGAYLIRPRVVFITDGKPTDESRETGPDVEETSRNHRLAITRLMSDFGSTKNMSTPKPVIWIPVGDADQNFLRSLARLGKGELATEKDLAKICRYYVIQDGIGKVFNLVRLDKSRYENNLSEIEVVAEGLVPDLSPEEYVRHFN